ncbi:MAG: tetratricopeptide repeat protein [Burkholderiaceae bacterium]
MKRKLNTVASLSVLGTLLGCAQLMPGAPVAGSTAAPFRGQAGAAPVKVAAAPAVNPAMPSHEALYTLGRAAHGAGQLTLAAGRYEQVLERVPDHVGALNALAVIHAQSDRTDEALKLFARARQLAPGAAHVHNNAGYALLRAGRLDEAELALKLARELDPFNGQTLQNLELLANAQAQRQSAVQVVQAVQAGAEGKAAPRLVVVAPNVYELQAPATPAAGATAAAATVPLAAGPTGGELSPALALSGKVMLRHATLAARADLRGVRLEVSNGAGITHLARRTADRLAVMGVATARLTNARPYRQMKTEIHYAAGQDLSAQALQARLPLAAKTVVSDRLHAGVQLRLVLGHDLAGKTLAAWLDSGSDLSAGGSNRGGWLWG